MRRILYPNIKTALQKNEFKKILTKTLNGEGILEIKNKKNEVVIYSIFDEVKSTKNDNDGYTIALGQLEEFVYIEVNPKNIDYETMMIIHDKARKMFNDEGTYGIKFESQIRSIINRVDDEYTEKSGIKL